MLREFFWYKYHAIEINYVLSAKDENSMYEWNGRFRPFCVLHFLTESSDQCDEMFWEE
jgi:hypothetical protein